MILQVLMDGWTRKSTGVMAFDAKVLAHNLPVYQRIPFFRSRFSHLFVCSSIAYMQYSRSSNGQERVSDTSEICELEFGAPLLDAVLSSVTD